MTATDVTFVLVGFIVGISLLLVFTVKIHNLQERLDRCTNQIGYLIADSNKLCNEEATINTIVNKKFKLLENYLGIELLETREYYSKKTSKR